MLGQMCRIFKHLVSIVENNLHKHAFLTYVVDEGTPPRGCTVARNGQTEI